ncbi:MAG TPA: AarF/UbiB family protein [Pyrinomonadaceae bacterium]|jgi:predicted unusual protein kinase regulating ubiquinone biosynthesis (AarF/ABC1/UbiB family)|nr:AarF/UbiB family protein [Pyrinomonadaceae bacterium]
MVVSLKPERLKRYKDVAKLLIKYGRSDLISAAGLEDSVLPDEIAEETGAAAPAEELAKDLEKLGPTFIKLGQLLSTRADLLPGPYLDALERLQDQIEPFPYEEVERIVSGELGVRMSKAFADFEPTPLAAASLSQVHRAYMRDGRAVVVKVQRPDIRELIVGDLEALGEIAHFLDEHTELGRRYEFDNMLVNLRKSLLRELDFTIEANNLHTISQNLAEFENIVIPEPVDDYSTTRILTMEYIAGKKITALNPLRLLELDGSLLADELFSAYLKQFLVDGIFHADPHPGNVFVTDDDRIALLDLGMVGRVTRTFQDNLLRLLLAISEGRGDVASEAAIKMGEPKENFDRRSFERRITDLVAENSDAVLSKLNAGKVTLEITRISADCWFRLPAEFTMIAKALLNLDRVVYTLDSSFDPNAIIRERANEILQRNIARSMAPSNLLAGVVDLKEFAETFPRRVNKILDAIGNNDVRIGVDAIDEKVIVEGLQKVANRITLGLVVASLIVGAALLMRVETTFRIFGYPGLAMILFLLAAAAGSMLAFNILFYDEKRRRRDKH